MTGEELDQLAARLIALRYREFPPREYLVALKAVLPHLTRREQPQIVARLAAEKVRRHATDPHLARLRRLPWPARMMYLTLALVKLPGMWLRVEWLAWRVWMGRSP